MLKLSCVVQLVLSLLALFCRSWDRISHSPGWVPIHCMADNELELAALLPPPFKGQGYRRDPLPHLAYTVFWEQRSQAQQDALMSSEKQPQACLTVALKTGSVDLLNIFIIKIIHIYAQSFEKNILKYKKLIRGILLTWNNLCLVSS